jgi:tetratricopeptide (TPR) repeat protein
MKTFAYFTALTLITVAFSGGGIRAFAADTNAAAAAAHTEAVQSDEMLRSYLQLQEQLHATQQAIEQNQREAREAATRSAEALDARLQILEHAVNSQRIQQLETMQSSNRVMVIVAGSFAVIGFVAMLLMAYFQWRTVNGLAQLSTTLPISRALGPGPALAAIGPGDAPMMAGRAVEQSSLRLTGALEQLEKRIFELEHTNPTAGKDLNHSQETSGADSNGNGQSPGPTNSDSAEPRETARIDFLLGKGQSMLNLDRAQEALVCFDEALALQPGHAEALVKKGMALERLQRLDEAIQCYDRAIAADGSLTIAYLHKGGLCNRLERFSEALTCYEQALRSQEKRVAS